MSHHMTSKNILIVTLPLIIGLLGLSGYQYYTHTLLQNEYAALSQKLTYTESAYVALSNAKAELEAKLASSDIYTTELYAAMAEERAENEALSDQIQTISGTVGQLDKLSKLDPELLQKYSRVFFLNEHYTPPKLLPIAKEFLSKPDDVPEYIHADVKPFLDDMLDDAEDDNINLRVLSGYRSFDEQKQLKGTYSVQYGTGANTFSADQGYSEHQLGTTIDFSTAELGGSLVGFEESEAYDWLVRHAYKYGFTLSYPENNAYYIFEPWHWRFVGTELADHLRDENVHFYDLEQREIQEYLISIFD